MEQFIKIEYIHTNGNIYSIDKELNLDEYEVFMSSDDPSIDGFKFEREYEPIITEEKL